ncbi:hypothetical protein OnM2_030014 [Erysiphe neolycopersici]|uniref:Ubiquitin-like-conjugating enzyme ATG10 n=1 Tax=Erysiphe neolycopersici TaxID=212602 RepID=A0A420HZF8_9PEZI|nr:hypothetical protein OnM2_030014 [Erysiphe neolycopersici]
MTHHVNYIHWPFVSQEEFNSACAHFNRRYTQAKKKTNRISFKISCRFIASTRSSYIQVIHLLQPPEDVADLSKALEKLGIDEYQTCECEHKIDYINEENDKEALRLLDSPPKYSPLPCQPYVIYEIHLHPTYRIPTLWFTLHDLHPEDNAQDIETVYRYLVPNEYHSKLRSSGITGSLSAAPHPVTDIPAFFVHPCQTKEAIENFDCPIEDYLMVWIGIVGGSVGLWLPPEMAQATEAI